MKAHWYHKGQTGVHEIKQLADLVSFTSPVPNGAQVWIPDDGSPFSPKEGWFYVTARSRIVPVPQAACKELRAVLLLQGIACP